ncbi:MAG: M48 family metalloprotease [Candidatus Babeliaceae bacterium]
MFINKLKTILLLSILSGICLLMGELIGGNQGLIAAFIMALIFNGIAYFFSDKIVLRLYKAQPLDRETYDWIYALVEELRTNMGLPMPKLWLITTPAANAFATGRSPQHASIALTTGILSILDHHELRGVLAHELSHIHNRDILITTLAATISTTICYCAYILRNVAYRARRKSSNVGITFLAFIIIPIVTLLIQLIVTLIQLAISRSREYLADETGAHACQDPLALASALEKIDAATKTTHFDQSKAAQATIAHLLIINPVFNNWFSTHPPVQERVNRLKKIFEQQHLS